MGPILEKTIAPLPKVYDRFSKSANITSPDYLQSDYRLVSLYVFVKNVVWYQLKVYVCGIMIK